MTTTVNSEARPDLVGRILAPALRLWLRSQLTDIDNLQLVIGGKNRQILTGHIPEVFLSADHAIYEGMHLSHAELTGQQIRVNLGQMLKGKPFRLLQPIPVKGQMRLTFADLQASLTAPLLATAMGDILNDLVPPDLNAQITDPQWQHIQLIDHAITLSGTTGGSAIALAGELSLADPHTLCIDPLRFTLGSEIHDLPAFTIDLGDQVAFEQLDVTAEYLQLVGTITVTPEDTTDPPQSSSPES